MISINLAKSIWHRSAPYLFSVLAVLPVCVLLLVVVVAATTSMVADGFADLSLSSKRAVAVYDVDVRAVAVRGVVVVDRAVK